MITRPLEMLTHLKRHTVGLSMMNKQQVGFEEVVGKQEELKISKQEVSRNLFAEVSAAPSNPSTPHILDLCLLPKHLVQQDRSQTGAASARHKCDVCGKTFCKLSSVRRHRLAGCCSGEVASARRRLHLGAMVVLVWEPVDKIIQEMEDS